MRLDRGTGVVERFMAPCDVDRPVNPLLIEGQLVGGCVQGLAMTRGARRSSVTFADYLLPVLGQTPDIEVLLTQDAPPRTIRSGSQAPAKAASTARPRIAGAIDQSLGLPGAVTSCQYRRIG